MPANHAYIHNIIIMDWTYNIIISQRVIHVHISQVIIKN